MVYRFGEFELSPERYELRRAGEEIKVEPRVFDVLVYLIEHRDRVVSKDELVERVWSGAFITDSALKRAVQEARRAIDDDGKAQRCIQTAYSRGYRFLPEIEQALSERPTGEPIPAADAQAVCVARDSQLRTLARLLETALGGQGGVAFVTGEAGTGKTTLVRELSWRALRENDELVVVVGNCNAQTGAGDPYLPFREVLDLLTGGHRGQAAVTREQSVRLHNLWPSAIPALVDAGPDLIDTLVLGQELMARTADLAGGKASWRGRLEHIVQRKPSPDLQQSAVLEQYTRVLQSLAAQYPLLLILDDLHWADTGSIHLLFHLGRRVRGSRILILGSYRPAEVAVGRGGERHPLEPVVNELKGSYPQCEVSLAQSGDREFVNAYLDLEPNRLGKDFREALYRQTEGHPLFTVELLRAMREKEMLVRSDEQWVTTANLDWELLPARLDAVIVERVERLSDRLQRALALASVEGEQFTCEMLARIQNVDEYEMVRLLSSELDRRHRLVRAQYVRRLDDQRLSVYSFRHILFQKYIYMRLDDVERTYLHELVGETLEKIYGGHREEIAARLARHFEEAGAVAKAVTYLHQAGNRAVKLVANTEAIAHFSKGLALVEKLPDSAEKVRHELALQLAIAVPLQAVKGFSAPELGRAYGRALELSQEIGAEQELCRVLWFFNEYHGVRAEHRKAVGIAERLMRLAERTGDALVAALAHWARGANNLFLGELTSARSDLEEVVAFYDPQKHSSLAHQLGHDMGVLSRVWLAWSLWLLGYREQALRHALEAVELARRIDHPMSSAHALLLWRYCSEAEEIRRHAEEAMRLSEKKDLVFYRAVGLFFRGQTLAERGRAAEGIERMHEGRGIFEAMGSRIGCPMFLTMLAETYGKAGEARQGLKTVGEALEVVEATDERFCEAEIYRIQGELWLAADPSSSEAEACFLRALETARGQSAKTWELRAATSLSRLWRSRSRADEARALLADVYGWFTEGLDTSDLKAAEALLGELS